MRPDSKHPLSNARVNLASTSRQADYNTFISPTPLETYYKDHISYLKDCLLLGSKNRFPPKSPCSVINAWNDKEHIHHSCSCSLRYQFHHPRHKNERKRTKDPRATYCKRGYFRWGKISWKQWQDISREGNFHNSTPISFIKAYGFYFRLGVIFAKKTKARKKQKLPPR